MAVVIDTPGISINVNAKRLAKFDTVLYATYLKAIGGFNEVFVATSIDGGGTWTIEQVTTQVSPGAGNKISPSLAVDSLGRLHLAYQTLTVCWYDLKTGAVWAGPIQVNEAVDDIPRQRHCEVLVGSDDGPRVCYQSAKDDGVGDWGRIYIRCATGPPAWTRVDLVVIGVGGGGAMVRNGHFVVCLNSANAVEVLWFQDYNGGAGVGNLNRLYYKGSKPSQVFHSSEFGAGATVCLGIATDSSDNIHLTYSKDGVSYRLYDAAFGAQEILYNPGTAQFYQTISIDGDGNIHILWSGKIPGSVFPARYNLQHIKKTAGAWGARQPLTDLDEDNGGVSPLWARFPASSTVTEYAFTFEREVADEYVYWALLAVAAPTFSRAHALSREEL